MDTLRLRLRLHLQALVGIRAAFTFEFTMYHQLISHDTYLCRSGLSDHFPTALSVPFEPDNISFSRLSVAYLISGVGGVWDLERWAHVSF